MRHIDRYTPEICSQLRQMAEQRQWNDWYRPDSRREELLEDLELTCHLHAAAEASGLRAGMAPMPAFPVRLIDSEGVLDPAEFIKTYWRRHSPHTWNRSDNAVYQAVACTAWVAAACLAARLL